MSPEPASAYPSLGFYTSGRPSALGLLSLAIHVRSGNDNRLATPCRLFVPCPLPVSFQMLLIVYTVRIDNVLPVVYTN